MSRPERWFDAHLDLAYLEMSGRDVRGALDERAGPHAPAGLTLGALREGGVRCALGTVFTEAGGDGPVGYPAGDAEAAHGAGAAQLRAMQAWAAEGLVRLMGGGALDGGEGTITLGLLVENADPIRGPSELGWWAERGVVAVGLAWSVMSRYAGGNGTEEGLTALGREMAREMDGLGIVHDASHLSDRALDELLELAEGRMMASHSNCRALLGDASSMLARRHLRDASVRAIAARGGVIGINLYGRFLSGDGRSATLDDFAAHVERVCDLAGDRSHVGLGSDLDGGFSASELGAGIRSPMDYGRMGEALSARGWSDEEVRGFAWGNWARFWEEALSSRARF